MGQPSGFSWIEKPLLAGMAQPESPAELAWLRDQGVELLLCLAESTPPRSWVNDAGLFLVHVPIEDMEAPTQRQLEQCLATITKALQRPMGVAVHCGAGLGRTGTVLAAWLVSQGMTAEKAIARIRKLRPGSVETLEQEEAVEEFARRQSRGG